MRAPSNRRVFVVGLAACTPLGATLERSWERAVAGEAGFRDLTRCSMATRTVVGEIPDLDLSDYEFATPKEQYNWNAGFVLLTMALCEQALRDAGLLMAGEIGPRTACLVGSAINGGDALRVAVEDLRTSGPNRVSPFLLPNVCANVPAGKAGALLGFTGPVFSPQGACASGNHAIGIGARMLRDGDADFALVGGVDMPLFPEIIQGFSNMNATITLKPTDRAWDSPGQVSRPFSVDRKGFVLAEGGAMLVLAAEDVMRTHGIEPRAEVAGIGWTSDAYHFTRPNQTTIVAAMRQAIEDAGLKPSDIGCLNAHGTSTRTGDRVETLCLREVFGNELEHLPITANKSQMGHSLGAAAAIEAVFSVRALQQQIVLPTINYLPDPEAQDLQVVQQTQPLAHEFVLSDAFGFGGTNCCVVLRGV